MTTWVPHSVQSPHRSHSHQKCQPTLPPCQISNVLTNCKYYLLERLAPLARVVKRRDVVVQDLLPLEDVGGGAALHHEPALGVDIYRYYN